MFFQWFSRRFFIGLGFSSIKKELRYGVYYLHDGESSKLPPTPIIVNMSIHLTMEEISI